MKEVQLFDFGAEGGGATVYRLANGKVVERGSSGGITDDEDDQVRKWNREYDSWENWWQSFVEKHKQHWICYHPMYVNPEIASFIKNEVINYKFDWYNKDFYVNHWLQQLKFLSTGEL